MNQADILKLAQAAGFEHVFGDDYDHVGVFCGEDLRAGDFMTLNEYLTRFAELIAQHEREECAKLLEQPITHLNPTECCADKVVQTLRWNFQNLAKAIRNRERKE